MALTFQSVDDLDDTLLNLLFPQGDAVVDSVFRIRDETKRILDDPNQIFNVEFEPGMSLNSLATEYIGDSFAWEAIATLNDVDPTKPIDIGKVLKIPNQEKIREVANKFIAPEANQIIESVKGSILDITGLKNANTTFANNLKDCVDKVIDFKVSF